jgi:hypothetical protein
MRAVRTGCLAPIMGLSSELAAEASSGTDEASSLLSGSGAEEARAALAVAAAGRRQRPPTKVSHEGVTVLKAAVLGTPPLAK